MICPVPPGGTPVPGRDFQLGAGSSYERMPELCPCCGQKRALGITGHLLEGQVAAEPIDQEEAA